jgi:[acyl-carrier-protein] S-malonyltransferase
MVPHNAGKVALCFPGQLSRVPDEIGKRSGGGYDLPHPFLERAWEKAGFDLSSFLFQREEEDLYLNLKLQVTSYLLSMIAFDRFRSKGGQWDVITEHSMGIYAALTAAESVSFEEGLQMTKGIGLILEKAGEKSPSGMAAIIGLGAEEIKKICAEVSGKLYVANVNGSRNFILSGEEASLQQAVALSLKRGAISAQRLTFTTPLHSPLLESIADDVRRFIAGFTIRPPQTFLACHWSGRQLSDPGEIREFLVEELYKPVDWEGCVRHLLSHKVGCFVELGPGNALTKLIRWIDRDVKALSYGVA